MFQSPAISQVPRDDSEVGFDWFDSLFGQNPDKGQGTESPTESVQSPSCTDTLQFFFLQFCPVLYNAVKFCTVLHSFVQCCTILHSAVQSCIVFAWLH